MRAEGCPVAEMLPADLIREGWRNLALQPLRSLLMLVAAAALLGGPMVVEALWLTRSLDLEERFERAGGYTAHTTFEQPILSERCRGINDLPYVQGAAGVADMGAARIDRQPQSRFSVFAVTAGALSVLAPEGDRASDERLSGDGVVALGPQAADELGVAEGDYLRIDGMTVEVAAILRSEVLRVPRLERAILRPLMGEDRVDECFVALAPAAFDQGLVVTNALVPDPDSTERFGPFTSRGTAQPPSDELLARGHRWAWGGAGLALGLLLGIELWARRSEIALIRSIGATARSTVALYMVERLFVLWFGLVVGFAAGLLVMSSRLAAPTPGQAAFVARQGLLATAVAGNLMLLLLAVLSDRVGAETLKDR